MKSLNLKSSSLLASLLAVSGSMATAEELRTVRISKEEINAASKPNFIKSRDLSDVLADKVKLLAVTITARQGGSNRKLVDIAGTSAQMSHDAYMNRLAILHYEGDNSPKTDSDAIRVHLLGQTRKSTEVKFKEAFPIVDRIRQGISFNFSFNKKSQPYNAANVPAIRYGLVAQDIVPTEAPNIASLGSMSDMGPEYSRPAKVIYTIDKLEADGSTTKVFQEYKYEEINPEIGTPITTAEEIFKRPSTDLACKIEAANSEDSVSDKIEGGALPGAKITVSQVDGLVSMQLITTSRLGKDLVTYDTRLPLYGEASITRKYDEKFNDIQTSAINLLGRPSLPKLNVHHLTKEEKFKGELLVKKQNLEWGVALEPRAGWAPGKKTGEQGDKVEVKVATAF